MYDNQISSTVVITNTKTKLIKINVPFSGYKIHSKTWETHILITVSSRMLMLGGL
jgi:hypothetical protein